MNMGQGVPCAHKDSITGGQHAQLHRSTKTQEIKSRTMPTDDFFHTKNHGNKTTTNVYTKAECAMCWQNVALSTIYLHKVCQNNI